MEFKYLAMLICLFIADYIGDYLMQTREMALKKSEDDLTMFCHGAIIFTCCAVVALVFRSMDLMRVAYFYTVLHVVQDAIIWKGYKKKIKDKKDFKYWEDKGYYDTIGLDSRLHTITLIILFWFFVLWA